MRNSHLQRCWCAHMNGEKDSVTREKKKKRNVVVYVNARYTYEYVHAHIFFLYIRISFIPVCHVMYVHTEARQKKIINKIYFFSLDLSIKGFFIAFQLRICLYVDWNTEMWKFSSFLWMRIWKIGSLKKALKITNKKSGNWFYYVFTKKSKFIDWYKDLQNFRQVAFVIIKNEFCFLSSSLAK